MSLRSELIQVAAVAVAAVEDLDHGVAGSWVVDEVGTTLTVHKVLDDVRRERTRQNDKWGPQHHAPIEWLMILLEEVGEAADEADEDATELHSMRLAGRYARRWLENHEWPERQQRVYDAEKETA